MTFAVLPARGLSSGLLSTWQNAHPESRDVHWSPAYGRAQEVLGGKALIAVMADRQRVLAKPFMLRQLEGGRSDIKGHYQYGGLFGDRAFAAEFEERFTEWCLANRVVSEFFASRRADWSDAQPAKSVVILRLPLLDNSGMSHGRRYSIGKAREAGVITFSVEPIPEVASIFASLYARTMNRRGAAARWRMPQGYFEGLFRELGDDAALIFSGTWEGAREVDFLANPDGQVHAGAVILFGGETAYYHFAASNDAVPNGAGDLVILHAAALASARGCRWLHLGGGVTAAPDDSLLAYKASFGGELVPVYTRRRIFDRVAYDRLCADAGVADSEFFPAYRAKEAA